MPLYDGTGPAGQGPRTGRGRGFCPPFDGDPTDPIDPAFWAEANLGQVEFVKQTSIFWGALILTGLVFLATSKKPARRRRRTRA